MGLPSKCAQDYLKRQEIQNNLVNLEILAEGLREMGIEIRIGTLRQAQENNWNFYLNGDECINGHIDARATNRRQCLQCRYNESRTKPKEEVRNGEKIIRESVYIWKRLLSRKCR